MTLSTFQKICLSYALLFSLVVTQKHVLRTYWGLSIWNNTCFLFKCRVKFWLRYFSNATFGTLALYNLRLRCLVKSNTYKKQLLFLEQNRTFPKRRWVRSEKVFLSSAGLDSLVVTTTSVLKTSSDLSTWNNTCFLFKCRVTFRLRQFSKVRFGTLALYILRLRCLVISNIYKKQLLFLEQNRNFPKRRWVRSRNVLLSSVRLDSLNVNEKAVLRVAEISVHETIHVFCSNAESRFGCAILRTLRTVLWLFTSCVWDVLRYRILIKTAFDFFGNVVFVILYCVQVFWWFSYKLPKSFGRFHQKKNTNFPKRRWVRSKNAFLSSARLDSLVVTTTSVLKTSSDLSNWNNTSFLFKCRVTFRLRQFSKARFGIFAL